MVVAVGGDYLPSSLSQQPRVRCSPAVFVTEQTSLALRFVYRYDLGMYGWREIPSVRFAVLSNQFVGVSKGKTNRLIADTCCPSCVSELIMELPPFLRDSPHRGWYTYSAHAYGWSDWKTWGRASPPCVRRLLEILPIEISGFEMIFRKLNIPSW